MHHIIFPLCFLFCPTYGFFYALLKRLLVFLAMILCRRAYIIQQAVVQYQQTTEISAQFSPQRTQCCGQRFAP